MYAHTNMWMALAVTLPLSSLAIPVDFEASTGSALKWSPCPQSYYGAECAALEAPLNYDDAASATIELTMVRLPCKNPDKRIGSWFFQEGGPGIPTSRDTILSNNGTGWQRIQENFDVVVIDERGSGVNFPIKCDPEMWKQAIQNGSPLTEQEWQSQLEFWAKFGDECKRRTGEHVWPTLDAVTAARDLETARVALGEGKINYYGLSWGTMRGQAYAKMFSDNIRTMILDGVVDHTLSLETMAMTQAVGFGLGAKYFFEWAKTNQSSALYAQDAEKIFGELVAKATKAPLQVPECKQSGACLPQVTEQLLRQTLGSGIEHEVSYPAMVQRIAEAASGNLTAWVYPLPVPEELDDYSLRAIWCNDWIQPTTYAEFIGILDATRALSNLSFIPPTAINTMMPVCLKWPARVVDPPAPLNITGTSAPILLVNAFRDPSTGYDAAVRVKAQIPASVILSRDGAGHGSMFPSSLTPATDIMTDYIITGKPPADWTIISSNYWQMPYNITQVAGDV